jgi:hypothetical protein
MEQRKVILTTMLQVLRVSKTYSLYFLCGSMQLLLPACQIQLHNRVRHLLLKLCTGYGVCGMVQYTTQQSLFLYESYVKCGSARECQRKYNKFRGNTAARTRI